MRNLAAAAAVICLVSTAHAAVEDDLRDGDRHFENGDWSKAAGAFDRAIAKAPGQVSAEAYGKRAAIFIILKDYAGGLAFLGRAKARFPSAPEVLEQEALILWETGKRGEAIEVAERVVGARPQTFTNQKLIGEYYAARDPQRTATAYEAYLANRPADLEQGDVLPRIRLGFAYLAAARLALGEDKARTALLYGRAREQFDLVQRRHGKRPNAQVNADNGLCAAYTGLGRFDEAVTVCERVAENPKAVDATGSVWFNLATAYLNRRQVVKARRAAGEFLKLRRSDARGFMLVGDTYFAERDWSNALDQYQRADKLTRGRPYEAAQISIRLGKTYRRLPAPVGGAANRNLELAIDKLAGALAANPTSSELAIELGGAYLEARQDAKATALTDKLLASSELAAAPAEARAGVLVLSGKALFNQRKLREARQRFEAAQQLRAGDITVQRALVLTVNEQAFEALREGNRGEAQGLLDQALRVDGGSPVTTTNLAVLAIERGECELARQHLAKLEQIRGHDSVMRLRLGARTWLCGGKPDVRRAGEGFAAAEREARKANAAMALAEIYTEWAPLTWDTDLAGAVDKLEIAVQTAAQDAEVGAAAKRNLAIALFRRGWKLLREGKAVEAASDFERAQRDPAVLKGSEPLAFEFSYALALVDAGRAGEATKLFRALVGKGSAASYLRPAFARAGSALFAAYAGYRSGALAARTQAAGELAKLEGEAGGAFGDKIRELQASAWELIAYEQWRGGALATAAKSLANADKYATGELKRRIAMDRAALALGKSDLGTLEAMGGNPPEVLINLGILYDQLDRPKDAYDAWQRARARGAQSRDLGRWIDAKKKVYGF